MRFDIYLNLSGLSDLFGLGARILRKLERLTEMSQTLAEQLAAAQADTAAKLDGIATDVTEIGADVDNLLAGMTPGSQVTQAMVDAATSIRDRVTTIKDGLDAVNAKVDPIP